MTPTDDPRAEERERREAGDGPTAEQAARFAAARAAHKAARVQEAGNSTSVTMSRRVHRAVEEEVVVKRPKLRAVRGAEETTTQRNDDLGEGVL